MNLNEDGRKPLDAMLAVDRLNSWVRSASFRRGWDLTLLRRRIYEIKRDAIIMADAQVPASHRPLSTLVTCRACGGDGYDPYAVPVPRCRARVGTGVVRLHFVESTFSLDGQIALERRRLIWHTPRGSWPLPATALGVETTAGDWTVNQSGNDLTADEAARDLLLCDETFPWPRRPYPCQRGCECTRHYKLYLGRADKRCAHCGEPIVGTPHRYGSCVGRAAFSFAVCDLCHGRLDGSVYEVPIPEELLAGEHVAEWVRRDGDTGGW